MSFSGAVSQVQYLRILHVQWEIPLGKGMERKVTVIIFTACT